MAKTSATERDVGRLHKSVNNIYIKLSENIIRMLESGDEEELILAMSTASPAMLTAMQNWVKQNNVSCIPDEVEEVAAATKEVLAKRKKRGAALLAKVTPINKAANQA